MSEVPKGGGRGKRAQGFIRRPPDAPDPGARRGEIAAARREPALLAGLERLLARVLALQCDPSGEAADADAVRAVVYGKGRTRDMQQCIRTAHAHLVAMEAGPGHDAQRETARAERVGIRAARVAEGGEVDARAHRQLDRVLVAVAQAQAAAFRADRACVVERVSDQLGLRDGQCVAVDAHERGAGAGQHLPVARRGLGEPQRRRDAGCGRQRDPGLPVAAAARACVARTLVGHHVHLRVGGGAEEEALAQGALELGPHGMRRQVREAALELAFACFVAHAAPPPALRVDGLERRARSSSSARE